MLYSYILSCSNTGNTINAQGRPYMNINPMIEFKEFWTGTLTHYMQNPWNVVALIIDIVIVVFLITAMVKVLKGSRAMQLVKGIIFLILITVL